MARKKSRRSDIAVPIASMGDIAFLLIIFFMVASNFAKESPVKPELARAVELEVLEQTAIQVAIDKDGQIFLNRAQVPDAQAIEYGVAALIEARGPQPEGADPPVVLFKCDRNVDKSVFEPVLDAIAKSGAVVAAAGERRQ